MDADRYTISQLVADLKRVCAQFDEEREILSSIRPLARRAALSKATWLDDRMYHAGATQGFGVYLLHEEPDHTLAILAVSWLHHRCAPRHDHYTLAMIARDDAPAKTELFDIADDRTRPGYSELKKVGEKVCNTGDVLAMPRGMIHSVLNETDVVTVSLHIYGKHINYTGRSQFDLEKQTETPFVVKMEPDHGAGRSGSRYIP
jgi:predicted metal-dependent enzyme (double-stranded beta helix superfamily)